MFTNRRNREIARCEHLGFSHGIEGIDPNLGIQAIAAWFEREKEAGLETTTHRVKASQAQLTTLTREHAENEPRRRVLNDLTGNRTPPFFTPLIALALVVFILIGEDLLLSPVFDAFGIGVPLEQKLLAAVVVVLLNLGAKIAFRLVRPFITGHFKVILAVSVAVLVVAILVVFGLWRSQAMIFSGSASDLGMVIGAGRFMVENPLLTKACVVLLTVLFALATAAVLDWALEALKLAREWRLSERTARRLARKIDGLEKAVEADSENLAVSHRKHDCDLSRAMAAYQAGYARGSSHGVPTVPIWFVAVKVAGFAAGAFVGCLVVGTFLGVSDILWLAVWFASVIVHAAAAVKSWLYPTPMQLDRRRTIARAAQAPPPKAMSAAASQPSKNGFQPKPTESLPNGRNPYRFD